jgi:hypothetical protein
MKNKKWKMKNEKWKMKKEKWKMKNEQWKMKNEKWKMKNENEHWGLVCLFILFVMLLPIQNENGNELMEHIVIKQRILPITKIVRKM